MKFGLQISILEVFLLVNEERPKKQCAEHHTPEEKGGKMWLERTSSSYQDGLDIHQYHRNATKMLCHIEPGHYKDCFPVAWNKEEVLWTSPF